MIQTESGFQLIRLVVLYHVITGSQLCENVYSSVYILGIASVQNLTNSVIIWYCLFQNVVQTKPL